MRRIAKLRELWAQINMEHFQSRLTSITIRVTRSKRTYGYFRAPDTGGKPSICISHALAEAEPHTLHDTMTHEMIHQFLHAWGFPEWDGHGVAFQDEHTRIFGHLYVEPTK